MEIDWIVEIKVKQVSTQQNRIVAANEVTVNSELEHINVHAEIDCKVDEIETLEIKPFDGEVLDSDLFNGRIPIKTKDGEVIYAEKHEKDCKSGKKVLEMFSYPK